MNTYMLSLPLPKSYASTNSPVNRKQVGFLPTLIVIMIFVFPLILQGLLDKLIFQSVK